MRRKPQRPAASVPLLHHRTMHAYFEPTPDWQPAHLACLSQLRLQLLHLPLVLGQPALGRTSVWNAAGRHITQRLGVQQFQVRAWSSPAHPLPLPPPQTPPHAAPPHLCRRGAQHVLPLLRIQLAKLRPVLLCLGSSVLGRLVCCRHGGAQGGVVGAHRVQRGLWRSSGGGGHVGGEAVGGPSRAGWHQLATGRHAARLQRCQHCRCLTSANALAWLRSSPLAAASASRRSSLS